jgi:tetratricopeptide (TPR) repeat protein
MNRTALAIAGVVLLGAGALLLVDRAPAPEPELAEPVYEDEDRQAIVKFWEHYRSGMKARRQGNWKLAVEEFSTALEFQPGHEDSLYYMGNALFELGEYEQAASSWRLLIVENPMASRAHVQLGQISSCPDVTSMFDLDVARAELEKAVALNPEASGPLGRLGEIELALGNRDRAGELFAHVRQMNPRAASAHYLGAYLAWKDADEARAREYSEKARLALNVSRVTDTPVLEGDIRPEDEGKQVDQTLSSRRLFAPLLQRLSELEEIDMELEASLVDAYLDALPDSRG